MNPLYVTLHLFCTFSPSSSFSSIVMMQNYLLLGRVMIVIRDDHQLSIKDPVKLPRMFPTPS